MLFAVGVEMVVVIAFSEFEEIAAELVDGFSRAEIDFFKCLNLFSLFSCLW